MLTLTDRFGGGSEGGARVGSLLRTRSPVACGQPWWQRRRKSVRSFKTKTNVALAKLDDLDLVNVTTKGQTGKTLHFYATDIDKRLCP